MSFDSPENDPIFSETDLNAYTEAMNALKSQNAVLVENLGDVQMMLEQRGWSPIFDYSKNGLDKHQLNMASQQIRELIVGNPIMKKGAALKNDYVFGKGVEVDLSSVGTKSKKTAICDWIEKYWGPADLGAWSRANYSDGNYFVLGDDKTKKVTRVPVNEITGIYLDPDDHEDVIAFRRTWQRMVGAVGTEMSVWYYTDTWEGTRGNTLNNEGSNETIDKTKTFLWNAVNRQVGWTWGIPDALPAIAWSRLYREFLENGSTMSRAMAKVALKLTSKTQAGGNAAVAAIATSTQFGQTANMPQSMDITALSSAGKGYDFSSGDSLAAMIATAIEVSLEDLLAKPDTDKAEGVPTSVKRASRVRQAELGAFLKRALVWFGAPSTICIRFPEIDDMDVFRKSQMLSGAWGTGLFADDEMRPPIAENAGIKIIHPDAPVGVLVPNNKANATSSVTTDAGGNLTTTTTSGSSDQSGGGGGQKPDGSNSQSNGQGRDSKKVGTQSNGNNDLRDGTTKK